ncbi:MAG: ATP-grasp domain-containing protein [Pseudomonadota bacterium]|nr:ATP-grasp domain-containing protein [Pseudomonadota bacterium]
MLLPSRSYRASSFMSACGNVDAEITVGVDSEQVSEGMVGGLVKRFNFSDPEVGAREILDFAKGRNFCAVIPTEEESVPLAAHAAALLNIEHNSVEAVLACQNKNLLRDRLSANGLPQPAFTFVEFEAAKQGWIPEKFPCVIKPTSLSGSCGIIRVNAKSEFLFAFDRVKKIALQHTTIIPSGLLVEDYLPGREIAVDALIHEGEVHVLAVFAKPDPLVGPYFPESIYLTMSPDSETELDNVKSILAEAAVALGLTRGPVHAEFRINRSGIYLLEVGARSIGGQCGSCLSFDNGKKLEQVIVEYYLGENAPPYLLEERSFGIMMLQVEHNGILRSVQGLERARKQANIDAINITIPVGQVVEALPEARRYLGFIFASSSNIRETEDALRRARATLKIAVS